MKFDDNEFDRENEKRCVDMIVPLVGFRRLVLDFCFTESSFIVLVGDRSPEKNRRAKVDLN